jgi:hypothetical protein
MGLREGHRSSLVTLSQDIGLDQLTDQFIGFLDRPLQFSLTSPGIAEAESVHQMSQRHGDVRGLHPLSFTIDKNMRTGLKEALRQDDLPTSNFDDGVDLGLLDTVDCC